MRNVPTAMAALALAAVLAAGLALSQPAGKSADGAAGERATPSEATPPLRSEQFSPERLRHMLDRRLQETTSRIERERINQRILQRAIDRLDAGATPREVFTELRRGHARADRATRTEGGAEADASRSPRPNRDSATDARPRPERVLAALREHMPLLAERFEELRDEDPARARALLERLGPPFREALELRERDPELAALKIEEMRANLEMHRASRQLAEALDVGRGAAAEQARMELAEAVRQSFDAHLAVARAEMDRLEQRLSRLRQDIERREQQRQTLIEAQLRRFETIAGPADAEVEDG